MKIKSVINVSGRVIRVLGFDYRDCSGNLVIFLWWLFNFYWVKYFCKIV